MNTNIPGNPRIASTQRIAGLFGLAVGGVQQTDGRGRLGKVTERGPTDPSLFHVSINPLRGVTSSIAGKVGRTIRVFIDFQQGTRSGQDTSFGQSEEHVMSWMPHDTFNMKMWKQSVYDSGEPWNQYFWSDLLAHELGTHGLGGKSGHFTTGNQQLVDTGGFNNWGNGLFSAEISAEIRDALDV